MSELRVALTFDAEHPSRSGNAPGSAESILVALSDAGVRATFFVQGRWASAHPAVARRIATEGHLVGNHSNYHAPMPFLSAEGMRADVEEAERRIAQHAGAGVRPWFRCPFGAGADRPDVLAALRSLGYRNVDWDVDTEDWCPERSPRDIRSAAVDQTLARGDGTLVLLHTWSAGTATALPAILGDLRAAGASFVAVDEVLDGG